MFSTFMVYIITAEIMSTLLKSVRQCVLRMTEDKISFVAVESGVLGGVHLWCELSQSTFFDEYRIEGRDDKNEIYLEIGLEQIVRAFKSAHSAQVLKMKLAKKEGAILSIEILQPTAFSTQRHLVHEVPVTVVPQRLWSDYQEPKMPEIDVSLYLPPLKSLKTHIDHMKNLSPHLFVSGNWSGELTLRVETDTAAVNVMYSNLRNHFFAPVDNQDDTEYMYEARVNIKRFLYLLGSQIQSNKVICNIVHGKGVQVFMLHEDVSFMYYLPSVNR
jgi:HUS1 checkpoint protein